jgi:hypothetical protein
VPWPVSIGRFTRWFLPHTQTALQLSGSHLPHLAAVGTAMEIVSSVAAMAGSAEA